MKIHNYIRDTRIRMGLTQSQFATLLKTKRANIANYETDRIKPPDEIIKSVKNLNNNHRSLFFKIKKIFKPKS